MAADHLADVLRRRDLLAALACRFNLRPAADVHPEHLAEYASPALLERLQASRRGERKLSTWLAERFELDRRGHWEVAEPRFRLALLSGKHLARLARLLGVAGMHRAIARVLAGAEARRIRASLGEDDYRFAIKRAGVLAHQFPAGWEAAAVSDDPPRQADELGWRAICGALTGAPPALVDRLALKAPASFDVRRPAPLPAECVATTARLAQRLVAFEVAPELAPCFS